MFRLVIVFNMAYSKKHSQANPLGIFTGVVWVAYMIETEVLIGFNVGEMWTINAGILEHSASILGKPISTI